MSKIKELLKCTGVDPFEIESNLKVVLQIISKEAVVVDEDVVLALLSIFENCDSSHALILNVIADLARNDANRHVLANDEIFKEIISFISSEETDESMQALRCICNITAENAKAKELFSSNNGVKILLSQSKKVLDCGDSKWNQLICPACNCIENIIDESDSLQKEFLKENALDILIEFLVKFYKEDLNISTVVVNGISSLGDSEAGMNKMSELSILPRLFETLREGSDEYICMVFENLLTEYGNKENTRVLLCKVRCMSIFYELISKRKNFNDSECNDPALKVMADLIVMLTSGEESFDLLRKDEKDLLGKFSKWIESPNRHIQVSAGLALGNYARSDETCADLVNNKIHENLINVIKENITNKCYSDRFEAYSSCLRNLTIPVINKPILIQAGLSDVAVELIKTSTMPVQLKSISILRLLAQGHENLATKLLLDQDLIKIICELSETSILSSIASEAQRLMATLVKYSNTEGPIRTGLTYGCMKPIVKLLSSDHPLMKNEGLIGLIMILANVHDCLDKITESDCLPVVIKIIKEEGSQAQTLFNALTFIQALSGVDGGKSYVNTHSTKVTIEGLTNHSEDIIRNKVTETLDILAD